MQTLIAVSDNTFGHLTLAPDPSKLIDPFYREPTPILSANSIRVLLFTSVHTILLLNHKTLLLISAPQPRILTPPFHPSDIQRITTSRDSSRWELLFVTHEKHVYRLSLPKRSDVHSWEESWHETSLPTLPPGAKLIDYAVDGINTAYTLYQPPGSALPRLAIETLGGADRQEEDLPRGYAAARIYPAGTTAFVLPVGGGTLLSVAPRDTLQRASLGREDEGLVGEPECTEGLRVVRVAGGGKVGAGVSEAGEVLVWGEDVHREEWLEGDCVGVAVEGDKVVALDTEGRVWIREIDDELGDYGWGLCEKWEGVKGCEVHAAEWGVLVVEDQGWLSQ